MATIQKKLVAVVLVLALVLGLCVGCNEGNSNGGLKLSPIYGAAITGAVIGGIIGHQSDETGEGIAVGAAVLGVGQLLHELDEANREKERKEEAAKRVVVEVHNDNGSITPVRLRKEGEQYIGPKGERYEQLPTEGQLKPIYGLK